MKAAICLCLVSMVATVLARPDDKYTDKYNNINVDEILSNDRLRQPYYKCYMDEGKCTPDAQELKTNLKEALEDGCAKCTDTHLAIGKKIIKYMINNQPQEWSSLAAKYDPEQKYSKKYEKELKELIS